MDMKLFFTTLYLLLGVSVLFAQPEKSQPMQEWEYPYELKYATLSDDLRMAYTDRGAGAVTLLFIHGLGSYLRAWDQNIDQLHKEYRCIAVDLPGYGKSSSGEYAYDMNFFAGAIRQFIDHLQLEKVVLIGHSMGGQIAMQTVLNDSSDIEKLVLLAPAGFETFSEKDRNWLLSVYTPALIKASPEEQIVKNFEINFYKMPDNARFMIEDRLRLRKTAAYDRYCAMLPQCVAGMLNEAVFDQLSTIKLPTLIIYGQEDLLIPNRLLHPDLDTGKVAISGHRAFPNSTLLLLPKAGHFVQWEQADRVNEAIADLLK
jgi:pimeloyl-ACP methyl ester carboxylesterase